MLVRRRRHLRTSHVERCWGSAGSLERRGWGRLRMLLRRVCLVLMRGLLVCSIIRQERHLYILPMTRSNLVRVRECKTSEGLVGVVVAVAVAVEGSLGQGERRSPVALDAAVEDPALDNQALEDLHSPVVLRAASRTARSSTVAGATWRIRVRLHSPGVP